MRTKFSFLVGNELTDEFPKNGVPQAVCFTTQDNKQYLIPLVKIVYMLTYDDAVAQAQKTEVCGFGCSLMPEHDLRELLDQVEKFNKILERCYIKTIPTTGARFWAEKRDRDRVCTFITTDYGRASSKYSKGNVAIGACLPALSMSQLHSLSLAHMDDDGHLTEKVDRAQRVQKMRKEQY